MVVQNNFVIKAAAKQYHGRRQFPVDYFKIVAATYQQLPQVALLRQHRPNSSYSKPHLQERMQLLSSHLGLKAGIDKILPLLFGFCEARQRSQNALPLKIKQVRLGKKVVTCKYRF